MRVGVREWKDSYLELALEPHKLNYSLSQTRTCNSNLKRAKPFTVVAQCTAKKEPGNPDLGPSEDEIVLKERRQYVR